MSILAKLYYEWYEPNSGYREGDREIHERYDRAWEEAEKVLDEGTAEELRRSFSDYVAAEACHDFQAGFRLGVQLMQELQPYGT